HQFTIGQRRKIGVALGHQIYVVDKDPVTNTVTIGSEEDLLSASCRVMDANWFADSELGVWQPCLARCRYNGQLVPAEFRRDPEDESIFEVRFETSQRAVTPGQAVVVHDPSDSHCVFGSGWIGNLYPEAL